MAGETLASSLRALSALQTRVLDAFRDVDGVWLTGGGALAGFHLGSRRSHDLDWFTADIEDIAHLARRLTGWCAVHGVSVDVEQEFPGFRRYRLRDETGETLVDLVHEPVAQVVALADKPCVDGIRVDPPKEIVANKLAALLGRGETKDLVDLLLLSQQGFDVLSGLAAAHEKDRGVEPATLAWVLSQVSLDTSELLLVAPVDREALSAFRDALVVALQHTAWPIR